MEPGPTLIHVNSGAVYIRRECLINHTSPSGTQEEANDVFEAGPQIVQANALSVVELVRC